MAEVGGLLDAKGVAVTTSLETAYLEVTRDSVEFAGTVERHARTTSTAEASGRAP